MPYLKSLAVALLLVSLPGTAWTHSLKDLEILLGDKEKYFQAIDRAAPSFSLQDADDRPVSLADLRGKVVVLHFIYAGCPDVCPLHAELIAEIQRMVNPTPMKDQVRFVSITTDPKNDTPDVLRSYGERHGLDPSNWTFLTKTAQQSEDAIRKLAEQFGHRFMQMEDGYQLHGIVTHVIDKEGRWRANFHGLKFDPTNLVVFINALVNDAQRAHGHERQSTWDKFKRWLGF